MAHIDIDNSSWQEMLTQSAVKANINTKQHGGSDKRQSASIVATEPQAIPLHSLLESSSVKQVEMPHGKTREKPYRQKSMSKEPSRASQNYLQTQMDRFGNVQVDVPPASSSLEPSRARQNVMPSSLASSGTDRAVLPSVGTSLEPSETHEIELQTLLDLLDGTSPTSSEPSKPSENPQNSQPAQNEHNTMDTDDFNWQEFIEEQTQTDKDPDLHQNMRQLNTSPKDGSSTGIAEALNSPSLDPFYSHIQQHDQHDQFPNQTFSRAPAMPSASKGIPLKFQPLRNPPKN